MCLSESELIRLLAGELPETESARVRAHLSTCPGCAQINSQLLATWTALADDVISAPAGDLTSRILAAARRPTPLPTWARVAATILLAVGAGAAAGVLAPAHRPVVASPPVSAADVVQALGLDSLADDSTALAQIVSDRPPEEEEL